MEQELNEMLQMRREKLQKLKDMDKNPYEITNYDRTHFAKDILDNFDDYEGKYVSIAGRVMGKRGHGKVTFLDILDSTGTIQSFVSQNNLGDDYEEVKLLDIGDIIGIKGEVFKTKMGEISVRCEEFVILTKSLQILPEKFHGLKDPDLRYRQRYVDLIVNPEIKETFIKRNKILKEIRKYLDDRDFLEVETPTLNTIAGGANARPFITHHNTLDIDMYLRIANELYLKRLIVGGFDRVYEMGKMFRNEGMDQTHNPEYTAIELYAAYADYKDMMDITENMVSTIAQNVLGTQILEFDGLKLDVTPPWRRITMVEAIKEYAGVDFEEIKTDEEAIAIAKEKGLELEPSKMDRGNIINEFFEEFCEDHMIQPTFVTHHPVEVSPLAKRDPADPRYTQRFEAFMATKEIANAFTELNDPIDQRARFTAQMEAKNLGDDEAHPMDEDFLNAIEVGLPPTGGLGIGVDRLIMFLTGEVSIRDVILFPTMKPIGLEKASTEAIKAEKLDLSKVKVEPLFEDMVDFEKFSESDFRVVKVKACEEVPKSNKLLQFTLDDGSGTDRTILSGIKNFYSADELVGKTLLAITNLPPRKMMGVESFGMLLSAVCDYDGEEKLNLIMLDENIPAGSKIY
ncbi:lysine--tRNA ligase [Ezakiella peruensis]|uniref:lysine--tRNA ligase n=1 Tax=Ezakiella peruensis TaxID=1464038 RepID=UPI000C1B5413|nr:lysine--tRNA ligase [Ezakiella peruensis]